MHPDHPLEPPRQPLQRTKTCCAFQSLSTNAELTDQWLRQKVALGADAIDFGGDTDMPGVAEQGYPNLEEVRALRKRVRSFGIDINRVTLPTLTQTYIDERAGADDELDNAAKALEVYGKARIPIARQRVDWATSSPK